MQILSNNKYYQHPILGPFNLEDLPKEIWKLAKDLGYTKLEILEKWKYCNNRFREEVINRYTNTVYLRRKAARKCLTIHRYNSYKNNKCLLDRPPHLRYGLKLNIRWSESYIDRVKSEVINNQENKEERNILHKKDKISKLHQLLKKGNKKINI